MSDHHSDDKVEWYADETGFHPSAPFLPKSVEPNHPEVAAAVRKILLIIIIYDCEDLYTMTIIR